MKKIVLGLSLFTFVMLASSMIVVEESNVEIENIFSDPQKTVKRKVGSFDILKAGGAVSIKIVDGDSDGQITITASEEVLKKLKTEVKNEVLEIGFINKFKFYRKSNKDKIEITIPHRKLRDIQLSGASNLVANHILKVENFSADISGAAKATIAILSNKADVEISGASKLILSGNTQNLNVEASGASSFIGEDLKANTVDCDASGASKAKVWAVSNLKVDASGASSVLYKSTTSVNKEVNTSGASSVKSF